MATSPGPRTLTELLLMCYIAVVSSGASSSICRSQGNVYGSQNWRLYRQCIHSRAGELVSVPKSCMKRQYFDTLEGRCLGIPGGGHVVFVDNSASCNKLGLIPHPTQARYYYVCKSNKVIVALCNKPEIFNKERKHCERRHFASNDNSPGLPSCETVGEFPSPNDCFAYYKCSNNGEEFIRTEYRCPKNTVYNTTLGSCNSETICRKTDLTENVKSKNNSTKCTAAGRFLVPLDCTMYSMCSPDCNGNFVHEYFFCPSGYVYNPLLEDCVKGTECIQSSQEIYRNIENYPSDKFAIPSPDFKHSQQKKANLQSTKEPIVGGDEHKYLHPEQIHILGNISSNSPQPQSVTNSGCRKEVLHSQLHAKETTTQPLNQYQYRVAHNSSKLQTTGISQAAKNDGCKSESFKTELPNSTICLFRSNNASDINKTQIDRTQPKYQCVEEDSSIEPHAVEVVSQTNPQIRVTCNYENGTGVQSEAKIPMNMKRLHIAQRTTNFKCKNEKETNRKEATSTIYKNAFHTEPEISNSQSKCNHEAETKGKSTAEAEEFDKYEQTFLQFKSKNGSDYTTPIINSKYNNNILPLEASTTEIITQSIPPTKCREKEEFMHLQSQINNQPIENLGHYNDDFHKNPMESTVHQSGYKNRNAKVPKIEFEKQEDMETLNTKILQNSGESVYSGNFKNKETHITLTDNRGVQHSSNRSKIFTSAEKQPTCEFNVCSTTEFYEKSLSSKAAQPSETILSNMKIEATQTDFEHNFFTSIILPKEFPMKKNNQILHSNPHHKLSIPMNQSDDNIKEMATEKSVYELPSCELQESSVSTTEFKQSNIGPDQFKDIFHEAVTNPDAEKTISYSKQQTTIGNDFKKTSPVKSLAVSTVTKQSVTDTNDLKLPIYPETLPTITFSGQRIIKGLEVTMPLQSGTQSERPIRNLKQTDGYGLKVAQHSSVSEQQGTERNDIKGLLQNKFVSRLTITRQEKVEGNNFNTSYHTTSLHELSSVSQSLSGGHAFQTKEKTRMMTTTQPTTHSEHFMKIFNTGYQSEMAVSQKPKSYANEYRISNSTEPLSAVNVRNSFKIPFQYESMSGDTTQEITELNNMKAPLDHEALSSINISKQQTIATIEFQPESESLVTMTRKLTAEGNNFKTSLQPESLLDATASKQAENKEIPTSMLAKSLFNQTISLTKGDNYDTKFHTKSLSEIHIAEDPVTAGNNFNMALYPSNVSDGNTIELTITERNDFKTQFHSYSKSGETRTEQQVKDLKSTLHHEPIQDVTFFNQQKTEKNSLKTQTYARSSTATFLYKPTIEGNVTRIPEINSDSFSHKMVIKHPRMEGNDSNTIFDLKSMSMENQMTQPEKENNLQIPFHNESTSVSELPVAEGNDFKGTFTLDFAPGATANNHQPLIEENYFKFYSENLDMGMINTQPVTLENGSRAEFYPKSRVTATTQPITYNEFKLIFHPESLPEITTSQYQIAEGKDFKGPLHPETPPTVMLSEGLITEENNIKTSFHPETFMIDKESMAVGNYSNKQFSPQYRFAVNVTTQQLITEEMFTKQPVVNESGSHTDFHTLSPLGVTIYEQHLADTNDSNIQSHPESFSDVILSKQLKLGLDHIKAQSHPEPLSGVTLTKSEITEQNKLVQSSSKSLPGKTIDRESLTEDFQFNTFYTASSPGKPFNQLLTGLETPYNTESLSGEANTEKLVTEENLFKIPVPIHSQSKSGINVTGEPVGESDTNASFHIITLSKATINEQPKTERNVFNTQLLPQLLSKPEKIKDNDFRATSYPGHTSSVIIIKQPMEGNDLLLSESTELRTEEYDFQESSHIEIISALDAGKQSKAEIKPKFHTNSPSGVLVNERQITEGGSFNVSFHPGATETKQKETEKSDIRITFQPVFPSEGKLSKQSVTEGKGFKFITEYLTGEMVTNEQITEGNSFKKPIQYGIPSAMAVNRQQMSEINCNNNNNNNNNTFCTKHFRVSKIKESTTEGSVFNMPIYSESPFSITITEQSETEVNNNIKSSPYPELRTGTGVTYKNDLVDKNNEFDYSTIDMEEKSHKSKIRALTSKADISLSHTEENVFDAFSEQSYESEVTNSVDNSENENLYHATYRIADSRLEVLNVSKDPFKTKQKYLVKGISPSVFESISTMEQPLYGEDDSFNNHSITTIQLEMTDTTALRKNNLHIVEGLTRRQYTNSGGQINSLFTTAMDVEQLREDANFTFGELINPDHTWTTNTKIPQSHLHFHNEPISSSTTVKSDHKSFDKQNGLYYKLSPNSKLDSEPTSLEISDVTTSYEQHSTEESIYAIFTEDDYSISSREESVPTENNKYSPLPIINITKQYHIEKGIYMNSPASTSVHGIYYINQTEPKFHSEGGMYSVSSIKEEPEKHYTTIDTDSNSLRTSAHHASVRPQLHAAEYAYSQLPRIDKSEQKYFEKDSYSTKHSTFEHQLNESHQLRNEVQFHTKANKYSTSANIYAAEEHTEVDAYSTPSSLSGDQFTEGNHSASYTVSLFHTENSRLTSSGSLDTEIYIHSGAGLQSTDDHYQKSITELLVTNSSRLSNMERMYENEYLDHGLSSTSGQNIRTPNHLISSSSSAYEETVGKNYSITTNVVQQIYKNDSMLYSPSATKELYCTYDDIYCNLSTMPIQPNVSTNNDIRWIKTMNDMSYVTSSSLSVHNEGYKDALNYVSDVLTSSTDSHSMVGENSNGKYISSTKSDAFTIKEYELTTLSMAEIQAEKENGFRGMENNREWDYAHQGPFLSSSLYHINAEIDSTSTSPSITYVNHREIQSNSDETHKDDKDMEQYSVFLRKASPYYTSTINYFSPARKSELFYLEKNNGYDRSTTESINMKHSSSNVTTSDIMINQYSSGGKITAHDVSTSSLSTEHERSSVFKDDKNKNTYLPSVTTETMNEFNTGLTVHPSTFINDQSSLGSMDKLYNNFDKNLLTESKSDDQTIITEDYSNIFLSSLGSSGSYSNNSESFLYNNNVTLTNSRKQYSYSDREKYLNSFSVPMHVTDKYYTSRRNNFTSNSKMSTTTEQVYKNRETLPSSVTVTYENNTDNSSSDTVSNAGKYPLSFVTAPNRTEVMDVILRSENAPSTISLKEEEYFSNIKFMEPNSNIINGQKYKYPDMFLQDQALYSSTIDHNVDTVEVQPVPTTTVQQLSVTQLNSSKKPSTTNTLIYINQNYSNVENRMNVQTEMSNIWNNRNNLFTKNIVQTKTTIPSTTLTDAVNRGTGKFYENETMLRSTNWKPIYETAATRSSSKFQSTSTGDSRNFLHDTDAEIHSDNQTLSSSTLETISIQKSQKLDLNYSTDENLASGISFAANDHYNGTEMYKIDQYSKSSTLGPKQNHTTSTETVVNSLLKTWVSNKYRYSTELELETESPLFISSIRMHQNHTSSEIRNQESGTGTTIYNDEVSTGTEQVEPIPSNSQMTTSRHQTDIESSMKTNFQLMPSSINNQFFGMDKFMSNITYVTQPDYMTTEIPLSGKFVQSNTVLITEKPYEISMRAIDISDLFHKEKYSRVQNVSSTIAIPTTVLSSGIDSVDLYISPIGTGTGTSRKNSPYYFETETKKTSTKLSTDGYITGKEMFTREHTDSLGYTITNNAQLIQSENKSITETTEKTDQNFIHTKMYLKDGLRSPVTEHANKFNYGQIQKLSGSRSKAAGVYRNSLIDGITTTQKFSSLVPSSSQLKTESDTLMTTSTYYSDSANNLNTSTTGLLATSNSENFNPLHQQTKIYSPDYTITTSDISDYKSFWNYEQLQRTPLTDSAYPIAANKIPGTAYVTVTSTESGIRYTDINVTGIKSTYFPQINYSNQSNFKTDQTAELPREIYLNNIINETSYDSQKTTLTNFHNYKNISSKISPMTNFTSVESKGKLQEIENSSYEIAGSLKSYSTTKSISEVLSESTRGFTKNYFEFSVKELGKKEITVDHEYRETLRGKYNIDYPNMHSTTQQLKSLPSYLIRNTANPMEIKVTNLQNNTNINSDYSIKDVKSNKTPIPSESISPLYNTANITNSSKYNSSHAVESIKHTTPIIGTDSKNTGNRFQSINMSVFELTNQRIFQTISTPPSVDSYKFNITVPPRRLSSASLNSLNSNYENNNNAGELLQQPQVTSSPYYSTAGMAFQTEKSNHEVTTNLMLETLANSKHFDISSTNNSDVQSLVARSQSPSTKSLVFFQTVRTESPPESGSLNRVFNFQNNSQVKSNSVLQQNSSTQLPNNIFFQTEGKENVPVGLSLLMEERHSELNNIYFKSGTAVPSSRLSQKFNDKIKQHYFTSDGNKESQKPKTANSVDEKPNKINRVKEEEKGTTTEVLQYALIHNITQNKTELSSVQAKTHDSFVFTSTSSSLVNVPVPGRAPSCEEIGSFRMPNSCHQYYDCMFYGQGEIVQSEIKKCQGCLVFNSNYGICDFPDNVPECSRSKKQLNCTGEGSFSVPDSLNKYYLCIKGAGGHISREIRECPKGQIYNSQTNGCVLRQTVGDYQRINNDVINCQRRGFFSHPYDCSKFVHCVGTDTSKSYISEIKTCPPRLYFNEVGGYCDRPEKILTLYDSNKNDVY